MLKATLLTKIVGAVLGLSLASSGLAYAGVDGAPNPVQDVIDVASSDDDEVVEAQVEGDDPPTSTAETPAEAEAGKATAEGKRQAARDYTDAVRDWTDCVQEAASAQGDVDRPTDTATAFSPHEACGDHPSPHDHDLTDVPEQASDEGKQNSQEGRERGEEARSQSRPSGTSGDESRPESPEENGDEGSDGEDNRPDDTPAGPPEGHPGR